MQKEVEQLIERIFINSSSNSILEHLKNAGQLYWENRLSSQTHTVGSILERLQEHFGDPSFISLNDSKS